MWLDLQDRTMFIAMNRFRVTKGSEAAFEHVWLSRDSHLDQVPERNARRRRIKQYR
jgi:hypothetical protein